MGPSQGSPAAPIGGPCAQPPPVCRHGPNPMAARTGTRRTPKRRHRKSSGSSSELRGAPSARPSRQSGERGAEGRTVLGRASRDFPAQAASIAASVQSPAPSGHSLSRNRVSNAAPANITAAWPRHTSSAVPQPSGRRLRLPPGSRLALDLPSSTPYRPGLAGPPPTAGDCPSSFAPRGYPPGARPSNLHAASTRPESSATRVGPGPQPATGSTPTVCQANNQSPPPAAPGRVRLPRSNAGCSTWNGRSRIFGSCCPRSPKRWPRSCPPWRSGTGCGAVHPWRRRPGCRPGPVWSWMGARWSASVRTTTWGWPAIRASSRPPGRLRSVPGSVRRPPVWYRATSRSTGCSSRRSPPWSRSPARCCSPPATRPISA